MGDSTRGIILTFMLILTPGCHLAVLIMIPFKPSSSGLFLAICCAVSLTQLNVPTVLTFKTCQKNGGIVRFEMRVAI